MKVGFVDPRRGLKRMPLRAEFACSGTPCAGAPHRIDGVNRSRVFDRRRSRLEL